MEIDELADTLGGLKVERVDTSQIVERNLSYTKYLESVLDIADEYHEIPDLLVRVARDEGCRGAFDTRVEFERRISSNQILIHSFNYLKPYAFQAHGSNELSQLAPPPQR